MGTNLRFIDLANRAVLRLHGSESLDFLQRMSTNDLAGLSAGAWRSTILVNEKARIVDVVSVRREADGSLLILSSDTEAGRMRHWLERFIIMEDIRIEPLSGLGHLLIFRYDDSSTPSSGLAITESNFLTEKDLSQSASGNFSQFAGELERNSALHVVSRSEAGLNEARRLIGASPGTGEEFEQWRILHGIPEARHELTEEYNPFELGLGALVSTTKGCYIGQEVLARLQTYRKVSRVLSLVEFAPDNDLPAAPIDLLDGETTVGCVTSISPLPEAQTGNRFGLAVVYKTHATSHNRLEGPQGQEFRIHRTWSDTSE